MSNQPCKTPLLELARSVPKDLKAEWPSQWWEDGTPSGHSMAPIGKYLHDMADRIEDLEAKVKSRDRVIDMQAQTLLENGKRIENLDLALAEVEDDDD